VCVPRASPFFAVLLASVAHLLANGPGAEGWKAFYNKGAEAMERGEPRDAEAQFRKAASLEPRNGKILQGLLLAELAGGQASAALETSQRLLRLLRSNPAEFEVTMAAGQALARHGQYAASIEFFKLAQQHAPPTIEGRDSTAYFDNLFAALLARTRQDHEAVVRLQHLVDSDPGEPSNRYQLGLMLIKEGSFPRAYEVMRESVEKFPRSFEIRLGYALACYFTGRNGQAEAAYRELIGMRPDSAQPYFALGNFYADTGRDREAAQAFEQAVKIEPDNYLHAYMDGVELYRTERIERAATLLRQAIRLNPRHADSHFWLGKVYLSQNQPEAALQAFEKAVQLEPKHIGAYYQLALLYKRRGDAEKAREALRIREDLTRQMHQGIVAERMTAMDTGR
jgi:tetratricopeptide (TPR) repeat protein